MALPGLALPNSQVVLSAACTRSPVTAGRPSRARFVYSSPSVNRKLIVSSSSINNPYTAAGGMQQVAAGEDEHELKLLGTWRGPFAMRVRLALNFKGLSYEYQEEDLANKSDLLLESNPVNKKVPVLIHNGVPICESLAILEYIDEVYHGIGPSILPADPYQRARARFWAAYIDNKMFVGKTDKEQDEGTKQTPVAVEMLEGALRECSKGKPFFGGDNVGYVDVVLGGMVAWMQGTKALCGVELLHATKTPLLLAWMERFGELEPAKVALPDVDRLVEFAKMKRAQRTLI